MNARGNAKARRDVDACRLYMSGARPPPILRLFAVPRVAAYTRTCSFQRSIQAPIQRFGLRHEMFRFNATAPYGSVDQEVPPAIAEVATKIAVQSDGYPVCCSTQQNAGEKVHP